MGSTSCDVTLTCVEDLPLSDECAQCVVDDWRGGDLHALVTLIQSLLYYVQGRDHLLVVQVKDDHT